MKGIKGKVCIITGGESEISQECATRFAGEGAMVVLVGKDEEILGKTIEKIRQLGWEASYFAVDFSQASDIEKMIEFTINTYGNPGILINNSQEQEEILLSEMTENDLKTSLDENLIKYITCLKYIIPAMKKTGGGSVINISSASATRGVTGNCVWAAAKGGVLSLTISAAAEYASDDIRINAIIPGIIKTEKYKRSRLKRDPGYEKKLLRHIPMGRLGHPDEVAAAALFLASNEASYITGASIPVDGGYCAV